MWGARRILKNVIVLRIDEKVGNHCYRAYLFFYRNNLIQSTCCTPYRYNYHVLINGKFQVDKTCTFNEINNKQKQFNETRQVHFVIKLESNTIISPNITLELV